MDFRGLCLVSGRVDSKIQHHVQCFYFFSKFAKDEDVSKFDLPIFLLKRILQPPPTVRWSYTTVVSRSDQKKNLRRPTVGLRNLAGGFITNFKVKLLEFMVAEVLLLL